MILTFEEVSFNYSHQPILENVSFTIQEGEFIAIIGPNGGGKTTLLKLIMGFLKPTTGKISLFGKPPKQAREKIGWVPQGFDFDRQFPITVLEVVLGGRLKYTSWFGSFGSHEKKEALIALEKVQMDHVKNRAFSDLSLGQAQRVLIARALASAPSLLLLDEPTTNVDRKAEQEIFSCLESLKGTITILMVTHNFNAVEKRVKKILCVQQQVSILPVEAVCQHFALGLYHFLPPTLRNGETS